MHEMKVGVISRMKLYHEGGRVVRWVGSMARVPEETVRDYMTQDPVLVSQTTTLGELAYKMIDVHIHQVIVADQGGKLIGIVTSTDVLAAVARADRARLTAAAMETVPS